MNELMNELGALGVTEVEGQLGVVKARLKAKQIVPAVIWPDYSPKELEDTDYDDVNLVNDTDNDILSRMSREISERIQFPINTVYIHGLAVIASAMVKGFRYEYNDEEVVSIYSVTGQPPSTGKSGVHNAFSKPIRVAFSHYNDNQQVKRDIITRDIKTKKEALKSEHENAIPEIMREIVDLERKLEQTPIYNYCVSDATPEALVQGALARGGMFNVMSDEGSAIESVLGNLYGNGGVVNTEGILHGWDNGFCSISRKSTGDIKGHVRGCVAVLAQGNTVKSILDAAANGNGVAERFFLLEESWAFGGRNRRKRSRKPIDKSLHSEYANLVTKLVNSDDIVFTFNDESIDLIDDLLEYYEPFLAQGQKYGNPMMQGVVGKADKRICKVACVLHVAKNWSVNGGGTVVDTECVAKAIDICKQMLVAYEKTAVTSGYIGEVAECQAVVEEITKMAQKGKKDFVCSEMNSKFKRGSVFGEQPSLSKHIREKVIPKLEQAGYCAAIGKRIYINPKLKGG